jgi:KipI family sensor histidine kinase inhibitor
MSWRLGPDREEPRFAPRVMPLGDSAVMAELADSVDLDANAIAHHIAAEVRRRAPAWVSDVVPAIVTVTVHFNASTAREADERREQASRMLLAAVERSRHRGAAVAARSVEIPVCYEQPFALDLEEIAALTALDAAEVVRLHAAAAHRVLMIGFVPGHPYIGGLDERLAVPRRATPRARVERGSVAIANGQTSIYPFVTPGGWNVIGRTPLTLFDAARERPSLLEPGDAVRFVPITRERFDRGGFE